MTEVAEDELSMIVWEGYLKKKTPRGVVKVWQNRYFRLLGDILEYYKSDKLGVCSGMIPLQMISSVKLHPRTKKGGCRFDVFVEGENARVREGARVFSLLAPSPALCAKLVRSLSNMIHAPADEQARMDLSHIDLSGEFWKRIDELEAERRRAGGVSNKNDLAQFAGFNIKRTQRKKRPGEGAAEDEAAAEAERARLAVNAGEKEHTTLAKLEREQLEAKLEEIEMPPIRIVSELQTLPIGKVYLARESESRVPFFMHAINRADEQPQPQPQPQLDAASLSLDAESKSAPLASKDGAAWTPAEVRELWTGMAKLNHPFLAKLVSRGESADCLWVMYTMPHHAPLSLHMAELLLQHREAMAFAQELNEDSDDEEAMAAPPLLLPMPVIQHLCCELLSLLDYLHTRGIVAARLDLKHLYLSAAGHIQLVDFFLLDAKEVGAAKRPERAEEFKAPEFYRTGSEDYRADFFRLGLVLYQLLTGCLPAGITRFQTEALEGAAKAAASVAHFSAPLNNVDEEPVKKPRPTTLDPAIAAKMLVKGLQSFDPAVPSQLVFPSVCPPAFRDFITKLLAIDPAQRLGGSPAPAVVSALLGSAGGDKEIALRSASIKDVQTHAWFHDDESAVDFPAFNRGVLLAQELLGGGGEGLPPNPPPAPECVLNSLLLAAHNHTYHRSTLLASQRLDYRVSVLVKAGRNFSVHHVAGEKVDRRLSMVADPAAIAAGLAAMQSQEVSPDRDNGMSPAAAAALDAELNSPLSSAARGSTTKFYTKVLVDGKALKTPIVDSARNKNENHNEWVWNKRMTFTGDERILEADLTARVLAKDEDSFHDANIGSVTLPMRQLYGASAALWKNAQREAALRGAVAQGPTFVADGAASAAGVGDAYSPADPCAVDSWFSVFGRDGFVVGELRLAIFVAQGEPRGGGQLAHSLAPVTSRRRFSALFGSAFSSDLARDAAAAQPSEVSMAEIRKPQLVTLDGKPAPPHPSDEQLKSLIPRRMLTTVQAAQGPQYHKPRMSILLMQHQATQRTLRATSTIGEEDEDEDEEEKEEKALAAHVNGTRPPMTRGASTSVAGSSPPPATAAKDKDTPVNAIVMSPTGGAAGFLRGLVSKKKFRFQEGGFDLDLSYIGDRIIAMGFPSEGSEATYRNPMPQVQSFFKTFHPNQFRIYNLCSERHYDSSKFGGVETGGPSGGNPECVRVFPFDDHNAPAFRMIVDLCIDAASFLNMKLAGDQENVVAIHCKAGKGRTGVMISALLLYMGTCLNPDAALLYYGRSRTSNQQGVTIPSQRRYVHYFHHYLLNYYDKGLPFNFAGVPLVLTHVRLTGIPKLDMVSGGCDPSFLIFHGERCIFDSAQFALQPQGGQGSRSGGPGQISGSEGGGDGVGGGSATSAGGGAPVDVVDWKVLASVRGDCKILFVDRDRFGRRDKMCWIWFHTSFIAEQGHKPYLCVAKKDVDKAVKDKEHKTFPAHFKIELFFKPQTDYCDPLVSREPLETVPTRDDDSDEDSDAERERETRSLQDGGRSRREVLQPWQMNAAHVAADLTHASLIADYQSWQSEQEEAARSFQPAALS